jgi:pimeloyl-ACP methyl ester carboxylesterase
MVPPTEVLPEYPPHTRHIQPVSRWGAPPPHEVVHDRAWAGRFQACFRRFQPPTLIAWGAHDPFFTMAGAQAYVRDLPDAELHLLEAGHVALETHGTEISALIRPFVQRRSVPRVSSISR